MNQAINTNIQPFVHDNMSRQERISNDKGILNQSTNTNKCTNERKKKKHWG